MPEERSQLACDQTRGSKFFTGICLYQKGCCYAMKEPEYAAEWGTSSKYCPQLSYRHTNNLELPWNQYSITFKVEALVKANPQLRCERQFFKQCGYKPNRANFQKCAEVLQWQSQIDMLMTIWELLLKKIISKTVWNVNAWQKAVMWAKSIRNLTCSASNKPYPRVLHISANIRAIYEKHTDGSQCDRSFWGQ